MSNGTDDLQEALDGWYRRADQHAGSRAYELARKEFYGPIWRRLAGTPLAAQAEDFLQELLVKLLMHKEGRRPRALALPTCDSPRAWRTKVLWNALSDLIKREGLRFDVKRAARDGISPDCLAKKRRDLRAGRTEPEAPSAVPSSRASETTEQEAVADLRVQRAEVVPHLEKLEVQRRVALGLLLSVDVVVWVDALATARRITCDEVLARLRARDGTEPADIAVVYGRPVTSKDRDAWRKLVSRGVNDIKQALGRSDLWS